MSFRSDEGVKIEFLGDSGPFSLLGTSICYRLSYKDVSFLVDCGVAVFSVIGPQAIGRINAIFATHSHEDHRRWFVDMALFKFYFSKPKTPLRLVASETVLEEFHKNSRGALERSLTPDSSKVVEIPFTNYVEPILFGPMARYRILRTRLAGEEGNVWRVLDEEGKTVSPRKAKVVIHPEANRPRLLFKDFDTKRWIEPESYYPFSEKRFFSEKQYPYEHDNGIKFEAKKAASWHGPPTVSIQVTTENEIIYFSSDTVYDPVLWRKLSSQVHPQELDLTKKAFGDAYVVYGDINNFIEQTWSQARYKEAMKLYGGKVLIHDVAGKGSVVHTDYSVLAAQDFDKLLLTHSPDHFVSKYPLTASGKTVRIIGDQYYEDVDGELWEFDADIYYKELSNCFVGYKARDGAYRIVSRDGILDIVSTGTRTDGKTLMRVNLYSDIKGRYFPKIEKPNRYYQEGPTGTVYLVTQDRNGGKMKRVESIRGRIPERKRTRKKA